MRLRVLLVDDEAVIGQAVRRALFGYDVVSTTSPKEALARLENGERFDAVIADVIMPDMDGRELAFEIAAIDRALADRVLFLTADGDAFVDLGNRPKLTKPFETHLLRAQVEELLRPTGQRRKFDSTRPTMPAPSKAGGDDDD